MAHAHSWLRITLGMHRLARELGHLWGRIPTWRIAELAAGAGRPEAIARAIREEANRLWPPEERLPGIKGPEAEAGRLVQQLGRAGQIKIVAHPSVIELGYRGADGRALSLWLHPNGGYGWSAEGGRPRDYARLVRVARAAEWEPEEGIAPPPGVYGPEYDRYMGVDLRLAFASPKHLLPWGPEASEEVEV